MTRYLQSQRSTRSTLRVTQRDTAQTERILTRLVITARPDSRSVSSHEKRNNIAQHPCIASVPSCVGEPPVARALSVVPEPTLRPWKIDPKIVMDLSFFKIFGWNTLQPSNPKLLEEFIDENEPWLLIRIPSRDAFLTIQYLERHLACSDQHMKRLIPLREGIHVTTQGHMRQHDAE